MHIMVDIAMDRSLHPFLMGLPFFLFSHALSFPHSFPCLAFTLR